jgi:2-polyprenyl-6-methoxyphenol hydroxylase-like FAD-dependent oxidoreductase
VRVAEIVIVGAGIGGLSAALLLGRDGHQVVVCERDPAPVPETNDAAWSDWPRPGIPQSRLGHSFLAGFRSLLAERLPDVLDDILASGAPELDEARDMPGDERTAADAELVTILCRRPVLEAAFRRAAAREPAIELRPGCQVTGLATDDRVGDGVPRVTGVTTRDGAVPADVVVLSGGRLGLAPALFAEVGATLEEQSVRCGFICYTRYFRIHPNEGENERVATQLTVHADAGYMQYEMFGADSATFCVELLVPAADRDFRCLRHEPAWTAAALALPECTQWISPDRSAPISAIAAMGGERNTLRRFVRDGRPAALGVHVIGDARCQTNSAYAWGSRHALAAACAVRDVIAEHGGDPEAQALALDRRLRPELAGRFEHSRQFDQAWHQASRDELEWASVDDGPGLMATVLRPAANHDAEVFRAVVRWDLQLDPVDAIYANHELVERARAVMATNPKAAEEPSRPGRDDLLEIAGAALRVAYRPSDLG